MFVSLLTLQIDLEITQKFWWNFFLFSETIPSRTSGILRWYTLWFYVLMLTELFLYIPSFLVRLKLMRIWSQSFITWKVFIYKKKKSFYLRYLLEISFIICFLRFPCPFFLFSFHMDFGLSLTISPSSSHVPSMHFSFFLIYFLLSLFFSFSFPPFLVHFLIYFSFFTYLFCMFLLSVCF